MTKWPKEEEEEDTSCKKTKFYSFGQNNSGGFWKDPAIQLIIEASSYSEAEKIAYDYGVYFNGCDEGIDCECCGDRWSTSWNEEGFDKPGVYTSGDWEEHRRRAPQDRVPSLMIVYANGEIKKYN